MIPAVSFRKSDLTIEIESGFVRGVKYKGESLKYIGSGVSRKVYLLDNKYVVKVEEADRGDSQCRDEYKASTKILQKGGGKNIAAVLACKEYKVQGITLQVNIQEYVKGQLGVTPTAEVREKIARFVDKHKLSDIHHNNVVLFKKKGKEKYKIIDLGINND